MSEMMTAEELAEARKAFDLDSDVDWSIPLAKIPELRARAARLLATVDALTERAERAEARVTELEALHSDVRALMIKHKDGEASALALADARGRTLEQAHERIAWVEDQSGRGHKRETCYVCQALALPAPEALRQQQEREAEKDALIETLRGAARLAVVTNMRSGYRELAAALDAPKKGI